MRVTWPLALAVLLALASGCSTAHTARPLGQGNHAIHLSVGGPIGGIGSPDTPVPLPTLTYKYGLTDRADVYVGWHILETFLNEGNVFFDLGASYYFLDQKGARPGLSGAFTISPLINRKSGWAMMDFQITASWALGKQERHLLYVGMHNMFAPARDEAVHTSPYTLSPYVGGQLSIGKKKNLALGLELKWHRPWANTTDAVVGYVGVGKLGALAFLGGVTIVIRKKEQPGLEDPLEPPPESSPANEESET
ncbi:MAG: hypothetical protein KDA24_06980 [Deltaproteobacteria bacterium]|nr:hypothetical protein [Deltaproteobacteria bacterium]